MMMHLQMKRSLLCSISISKLIRKIHSYSYAVFNRTEDQISATLDVSKSRNLAFNLEDAIVTKTVEPRSMEFMIHAQSYRDAEDYFRWASLSWTKD